MNNDEFFDLEQRVTLYNDCCCFFEEILSQLTFEECEMILAHRDIFIQRIVNFLETPF